jgi:hypothetical protein
VNAEACNSEHHVLFPQSAYESDEYTNYLVVHLAEWTLELVSVSVCEVKSLASGGGNMMTVNRRLGSPCSRRSLRRFLRESILLYKRGPLVDIATDSVLGQYFSGGCVERYEVSGLQVYKQHSGHRGARVIAACAP